MFYLKHHCRSLTLDLVSTVLGKCIKDTCREPELIRIQPIHAAQEKLDDIDVYHDSFSYVAIYASSGWSTYTYKSGSTTVRPRC